MRTILLVIMNSGGRKSIHEIQIDKICQGKYIYLVHSIYKYVQVCSNLYDTAS